MPASGKTAFVERIAMNTFYSKYSHTTDVLSYETTISTRAHGDYKFVLIDIPYQCNVPTFPYDAMFVFHKKSDDEILKSYLADISKPYPNMITVHIQSFTDNGCVGESNPTRIGVSANSKYCICEPFLKVLKHFVSSNVELDGWIPDMSSDVPMIKL